MSSLKTALAYDAVDTVTLNMAEAVGDTRLVVVCTPIGTFPAMFRAMAPHLPEGCIVTDVGSTKAHVVRLARKLLPPHARFVGSHPVAGSEKTGVEFARADLFQNAVCIVTPTARTDKAAVSDVVAFWDALGACTHTLSPSRHDAVLARVSHLPHAVACALVLLSQAGRSNAFAGPGFGDTTRIASGDPALWRDIFSTNRTATLAALRALERELARFRRAVASEDEKALETWLARAKSIREAWVAQRYARMDMEA